MAARTLKNYSFLLWLLTCVFLLPFVENDSCTSADDSTDVSVDCNDIYLDWSSDMWEIYEIRLFATCKKSNSSQSRFFSTVTAIPQTNSFHLPLLSSATPLPGEQCEYYGCVTDDFELVVLTFPTVTCTKPTLGVDDISPISTTSGWTVLASMSKNHDLTLPQESKDTSPMNTKIQSSSITRPLGEDILSTSIPMSEVFNPFSMEFAKETVVGSLSQDKASMVHTSQELTVHQENLSSVLPVVAPVLGVMTVAFLSLLASLGIGYLVKAYRKSSIREKRVLGYCLPVDSDTEENMDHLHSISSYFSQLDHHSSTSSIITILDPLISPLSTNKMSLSNKEVNDGPICLADPPNPWGKHFLSGQVCDSSGFSSDQAWNGYVPVHDVHCAPENNGWNSDQMEGFDILQDERTEASELDDSKYHHFYGMYDEENVAMSGASKKLSALSTVEVDHLELKDTTPDADAINMNLNQVMVQDNTWHHGNRDGYEPPIMLSKYIVDCNVLGSCGDEDSLSSGNSGGERLSGSFTLEETEVLGEEKELSSPVQNVQAVFCTPI